MFLHIDPANQVEVRHIVKTGEEVQFEQVIKQAHDFSCGSAALATFLRYHLGEELNERQVIRGMLQYGDSEKIRQRRAFSMLDMKKFVTVLGYKGVGYKAEIEDLETLGDLETAEPQIIKVSKFAPKPITAQEAVMQITLSGDDFLMFSNSQTNQVNVIYKRKDGNYGWIEPDFE